MSAKRESRRLVMPRERAPHFLRVVQALALVSGLGPAAIVAANVVACSSTGDLLRADAGASVPVDNGCSLGGICGAPSEPGPVPYPNDASGILAYDGWPMGSEDAGVIGYPFDGGPTGVVVLADGSDDGSLADAPVDVGPPAFFEGGGPLAAPELPT